jgi:hypothetical protein
MNSTSIKGVITDCRHEIKYDPDGNAFKDYVFKIGKQQYTAQVKADFYLQEEMTVSLELKPGSASEVVSGYCIKEGYAWGEDASRLKKTISRDEKYDFLEGRIIEKRKSTKGSIYMNRDNDGSRVSYTIVMENGEFGASRDEGDYLQVGMEIAVVIEKKESIVILDKAANKYLGLSTPYFILFLLALVGYNGYVLYLAQHNSSSPVASTASLVVINVFLLLAFVLSFLSYRVTSAAKRFLDGKRFGKN